MQIVTNDRIVRSFNPTHSPAARVRPGEVFVMQTNDRFRDWTDGATWPVEQLSMMTGPVFVESAGPGDTLAVDVLDIQARLGFGYVVAIPGYGLLKDQVEFCKKTVPIAENRIRYSDAISLPFVPNVSRIGVAPAAGAEPSSAVGTFGGQLSNGQLGVGATILLPVGVAGGLLSIEDVHACMGDGEAAASAVEIAADVTLRCRLSHDFAVERPVVLTKTEVQTLGNGDTMDAAARDALQDLSRLLVERAGVSETEAAMLASVAADLRISEMAGTPCHARAAVPREILRV